MDSKRWAEDNLIVVTVTGSRLYGTARADSDIDLRGVCYDMPASLMGMHRFEQYTNIKGDDDVVIYSMLKFIKLASGGNPSILDILFAPEGFWKFHTDEWYEVYEARRAFLSQKIRKTFSGYAYSQLKRIQRHKRWIDNPPEKPNLENYGLYLRSTKNGGQEYTPLPNRRGDIGLYKNALREYKKYEEWRENRNPYRAKLEERYGYDVKHAGHLLRLLIQGVNILTYCDYSPVVSEMDLDRYIRPVLNGEMSYETLVKKAGEFDDHISSMHTELPKSHDKDTIKKLTVAFFARSMLLNGDVMEVIEREVCGD